ncbi:hypothetical protein EIP91_006019 [Steccherinum ochraceum]|uniref:DUF6533 domain-containing protein n=1 Tax=Steccherinum ochraceum TaxID=92696 RepID=A0A4R0R6N9_9APHY|nr:hypothetical protein EIP91_006019 [Steccherinum ochraceum]
MPSGLCYSELTDSRWGQAFKFNDGLLSVIFAGILLYAPCVKMLARDFLIDPSLWKRSIAEQVMALVLHLGVPIHFFLNVSMSLSRYHPVLTFKLSFPGLLSYDYVLTFPYEVERIWKRKFSAGGILYVALRYSALVDGILQMTTPTMLWVYVSYSLDLIQRLTRFGLQIIAVAGDLLVLVLTWIKTRDSWLQSRAMRKESDDNKDEYSQFPTTTNLIEYGLLYFVGLLALNVVSLFLDIFQSDAAGTTSFRIVANAYTLPTFTLVAYLTLLVSITTNLIARFILDLRHCQPWYVRTTYESEHGDAEDMHFAQHHSCVGNMGATLRRGDSTWFADLSDESGIDLEHENRENSNETEGPMKTTGVDRGVGGQDLLEISDSAGSDSHAGGSEDDAYKISGV